MLHVSDGWSQYWCLRTKQSFSLSLGHATQQQKLQSSPRFGVLKADCPTSLLTRRSVFFTDTGIICTRSRLRGPEAVLPAACSVFIISCLYEFAIAIIIIIFITIITIIIAAIISSSCSFSSCSTQ